MKNTRWISLIPLVFMSLTVPVIVAAGDASLLAPVDLGVVQVGYESSSEGAVSAVILRWRNAEEYDRLQVFADDVPVAPVLFGAETSYEIRGLPAGVRTLGVQAHVGDESSATSIIDFEVLDASPVTDPVTDIACEFVWLRGGELVLSWSAGSSDWSAAEATFGASGRTVEIDAGADGVEIDKVGLEPVEVSLRFRDAGGYYSEPIVPSCSSRRPEFIRGDCNDDGRVSITDAIFELRHLFRGHQRWYCDDACDVNDDGETNLSDPVSVLNVLFLGSAQGRLTVFVSCTVDETDDFLGGVCTCP